MIDYGCCACWLNCSLCSWLRDLQRCEHCLASGDFGREPRPLSAHGFAQRKRHVPALMESIPLTKYAVIEPKASELFHPEWVVPSVVPVCLTSVIIGALLKRCLKTCCGKNWGQVVVLSTFDGRLGREMGDIGVIELLSLRCQVIESHKTVSGRCPRRLRIERLKKRYESQEPWQTVIWYIV
jgi:hypothetical protein